MCSCCNTWMIGQCLINNEKTTESKERQSRSRESSLFCSGDIHGAIGRWQCIFAGRYSREMVYDLSK